MKKNGILLSSCLFCGGALASSSAPLVLSRRAAFVVSPAQRVRVPFEDKETSLNAETKSGGQILRETVAAFPEIPGVPGKGVYGEVRLPFSAKRLAPALASTGAFALFFRLTKLIRSAFGVDGKLGGALGLGEKGLSSASANAFQRVYLPSLGILLGGLTSFTIGILQQKQLGLAATLQEEAASIDILEKGILRLFRDSPKRRDDALKQLKMYTAAAARDIGMKQGLSPNDPSISPDDIYLSSSASGLHQQGLEAISQLSDIINNITPEEVQQSDDFKTMGKFAENQILQLQGELAHLRQIRGKRALGLKKAFPQQHYLLLLSLAVAQLSAFVFDNINERFDEKQISLARYAFSIIVGLYSWVGSTVLDLSVPWTGKYSVIATPLLNTLERMQLETAGLDSRRSPSSPHQHIPASNKQGSAITKRKTAELV